MALCIKCNKEATYTCQRCQETYCSSECQAQDWQEHKQKCQPMPDLVPMNGQYDPGDKQFNGDFRCSSIAINRDENGQPVATINVDYIPKTRSLRDVQLWKIPFEPPKKQFFDVYVQCVDSRERNEFWVMEARYQGKFNKLAAEIKEKVGKKILDVRAGSLVAAPLQDNITRAVVLKVDAELKRTIVQYIDYGAKAWLRFDELLMSIPVMYSQSAFAFRVKLNKENGVIAIGDLLTIRILESNPISNDYLVELQIQPKLLQLPAVLYTMECEVTIVKCFADNCRALVQVETIFNGQAEMNAALDGKKAEQYKFNKSTPTDGTFVAARIGDIWGRARLIGCWDNCRYLLYFIDQGCMQFSNNIRKLPESYKNAPMNVVGISLIDEKSLLNESQLVLGEKYTLTPLPSSDISDKSSKVLRCSLHSAAMPKINVFVTNFTGYLNELKLDYWYESIEEDSSVIITHVLSYIEVYIAPAKFLFYAELFTALGEKCAMLRNDTVVNIGDMLLAYNDTNSTFFRGKVIECQEDGKAIVLMDLDSGCGHKIERQHLRHPTLFVRCCPIYAQKVNLIFMENVTTAVVDNQAIQMLKKFQMEKLRFDVTFDTEDDDNSNTVNLRFQTNTRESLSKRLVPLAFETAFNSSTVNNSIESCNISDISNDMSNICMHAVSKTFSIIEMKEIGNFIIPVSIERNVAKSSVYKLEDIELLPLPEGENVVVLVMDTSNLNSSGFITAIDGTKNDIYNRIEEQLKLVCDYGKCPHDNNDYEPEIDEICVALYDDGKWYRGLCMEHLKDGRVMICFIDFGNMSRILKRDILPISEDLMFPCWSNRCTIEGLTPNKYTDFQIAVDKQSSIKCTVSLGVDFTYTIKLNDLTNFLANS